MKPRRIEPDGALATALGAVAAFAVVSIFVRIGAATASRDGGVEVHAISRLSRKRIELKRVDAAALPATQKGIPNSLGYLGGVDDGLTPEEREQIAAENAEEERLAAEEAELARTAPEPKTNPDVDKDPAPPAPKPVPAARAPFKPLPNPVRLNGGAGMAGGVSRHFDSAPLPKSAPKQAAERLTPAN